MSCVSLGRSLHLSEPQFPQKPDGVTSGEGRMRAQDNTRTLSLFSFPRGKTADESLP